MSGDRFLFFLGGGLCFWSLKIFWTKIISIRQSLQTYDNLYEHMSLFALPAEPKLIEISRKTFKLFCFEIYFHSVKSMSKKKLLPIAALIFQIQILFGYGVMVNLFFSDFYLMTLNIVTSSSFQIICLPFLQHMTSNKDISLQNKYI